MIQSHLGEIYSLFTAIFWTITAICFEIAGKKIGSLSVNYIRLIMGFILISLFTTFSRGMMLPVDATLKSWIFLSISGLIGFVIGDLFCFRLICKLAPEHLC